MKVLVACEFSATVRDAFRAAGHDAWSTDVLPTEGDPRWHHLGDARDFLDREWEMIIAFPPCTYLTNSGVRWLHSDQDRWQKMREGAAFFRAFLDAPAPRIAVEDPVMHGYAAELIGQRQHQVIQPWMFGHPESKGTGLWLKNLPPLVPTHDVHAAAMALSPRERNKVHWASGGPNRWKVRSRTYPRIAQAMAQQWGSRAQLDILDVLEGAA